MGFGIGVGEGYDVEFFEYGDGEATEDGDADEVGGGCTGEGESEDPDWRDVDSKGVEVDLSPTVSVSSFLPSLHTFDPSIPPPSPWTISFLPQFFPLKV